MVAFILTWIQDYLISRLSLVKQAKNFSVCQEKENENKILFHTTFTNWFWKYLTVWTVYVCYLCPPLFQLPIWQCEDEHVSSETREDGTSVQTAAYTTSQDVRCRMRLEELLTTFFICMSLQMPAIIPSIDNGEIIGIGVLLDTWPQIVTAPLMSLKLL